MEYKNNQNAKNSIFNESNEISNITSKSFENIIKIDDIINFISSNFYSIIDINKSMKKKQKRGINEPFYNKKIPVLSLNKYLIRIIKYTECENNTLLVAYLYIVKLIQKENFVLGINNVYRLLLGAVVLAKKVLEDIRFDNSYYCDIGGISNSDLNAIEYSLLIRIDFKVNLKKEDLDKIYEQIFNYLINSSCNENVNNLNINNNINSKNVEYKDNKLNISNKFEDIKNKESQTDKNGEDKKDECKNKNNGNNFSIINNG